MKRILLVSVILLSGCASAPKGSIQIMNIESGEIMFGKEVIIAKAECLLEKNKIPIPSAVASVQNCGSGVATDALSGFAQGFCNGQNQARQAEAYSIRDAALAERKQVYEACLLLKGYQETWVADQVSSPIVDDQNMLSGFKFTEIDCRSDTAKCLNEAAEICDKSDYKVVNSWSNAGGLLADLIPGPYTWYHMEIVCGLPNDKQPTFEFRG